MTVDELLGWGQRPGPVRLAHGPTRRSECRDLFSRYVDTMPDSGFRRWAEFTATDGS